MLSKAKMLVILGALLVPLTLPGSVSGELPKNWINGGPSARSYVMPNLTLGWRFAANGNAQSAEFRVQLVRNLVLATRIPPEIQGYLQKTTPYQKVGSSFVWKLGKLDYQKNELGKAVYLNVRVAPGTKVGDTVCIRWALIGRTGSWQQKMGGVRDCRKVIRKVQVP